MNARRDISTDRGSGEDLITTDPMPADHRNAVTVFRHRLLSLKVDCSAAKKRSRTLPFLYSAATFCLLTSGTCAANLWIYTNTDPRPSNKIGIAYLVGLCAFLAAGVVLLIWALTSKADKDDDWDLVMGRIDEINYGNPSDG